LKKQIEIKIFINKLTYILIMGKRKKSRITEKDYLTKRQILQMESEKKEYKVKCRHTRTKLISHTKISNLWDLVCCECSEVVRTIESRSLGGHSTNKRCNWYPSLSMVRK
jgi:hypothetical protein